MNTTSKTPKIVGAILGIAVIGAGLAWAFGYGRTPEQEEALTVPDDSSAPTSTSESAPAAGAPATAYRDGTYRANGSYTSPGGGESVMVSLTLKGDVITDATFAGNTENATSKLLQDKFAAGYRTQVIGKNIDSLQLGVVNGSSLTPIGFMDAVAKIKAEARS